MFVEKLFETGSIQNQKRSDIKTTPGEKHVDVSGQIIVERISVGSETL